MAFKLERFDIIKQNYDKTGLYFYHDTVGAANGADGDALATILADDFFNPVVEELADLGGVIIVTATDGVALVKVTQLYDAGGEVEVKVAKLTAEAAISDKAITNAKLADDVKVGSLATLTTTAKASVVAAINEVNAKAAANQADSTADALATLVTDFNNLLAKLKAAGLMAAE